MPRYFFNTRIGEELIPDPEGEELRDADQILLVTTAGGIMPASRIDGRIMGNDRPGPVFRRLHDAFWDKRAAGWHATPVDYASGTA